MSVLCVGESSSAGVVRLGVGGPRGRGWRISSICGGSLKPMVSMVRCCDDGEGELSSELAKEARLSAKLFALYLIDSMA